MLVSSDSWSPTKCKRFYQNEFIFLFFNFIIFILTFKYLNVTETTKRQGGINKLKKTIINRATEKSRREREEKLKRK